MRFFLQIIFFLMYSSSLVAQAPSVGLVEIFDGLDVPYGIAVGNVTVAEDRNGTPCAIEFDGELTSVILVQGVEDFVIHPDSSLSISLWYRGGSDEAGDLESLFIKYSSNLDPHSNPVYGLQLYDLNTPLMASTDHSLWVDQSVIEFPGDSSWHHLVGVFEAGYWKVYFDNQLHGTSEDINAVVGSENHDIAIGAGFEGRLDDIYFYDRALSADEVDLLFNVNSLCAVGIPEWEELDVNVFPNPSSGKLQIDLHEVQSDWLEIIDVQGRVVKSRPLFLKQTQIDLKDLNDGRYIIRFQHRGNVIGQRSFMMNC